MNILYFHKNIHFNKLFFQHQEVSRAARGHSKPFRRLSPVGLDENYRFSLSVAPSRIPSPLCCQSLGV